MTKHIPFILITAFLLNFSFSLYAQDKTNTYQPFKTAEIYFEQNATDGDAEVVFKAKAGDDGMTKLKVVSPNGRTVIDFVAPDATMGIRSFHMESPEPESIDAIKEAYPEGVYKFSGTTVDGTEYMSEAALSHILPQTVTVQYPADEAENIETSQLKITWLPIKGAESYLIEVEQDELNVKVEAQLLNSQTTFSVPENFLQPDLEYKIVIGAESTIGNLNFVETSFKTVKE